MNDFYKSLLGGAAFCVVLAVAGGLLTRLSPWYDALKKPSWKPPDWAFGPIWTVVFAFMTFAIATAWTAADDAQRVSLLWVLGINGALNIAWSGIFFVMKNPAVAFFELLVFWVSIVALIVVFAAISLPAALMLLPYLMWVTAAGVLNGKIVRLNRA